MFNFKNKSMQAKMIALNGAIVVAIAVGVIFEIHQFTSVEEKNILNGFQTLADGANDSIRAQFYERYGDVQAFALNPQVQAHTREEIESALDSYVMLYGIYDLIIVADLNGRVVGVNRKDISGKEINSKSLYGKSVAGTEWFKKVVAGKFTEDKEKGFTGTYVEDVELDSLVSDVYGEKRIGNSFSTIIKDKAGRPIGVISNRAGSRWFEGELENALISAWEEGYKNAEIAVVNSKGVLIAEAKNDESEKISISRDFNLLTKFNMLDAGVGAAISVIKTGKPGSDISFHTRRKIDVISGFTPISGKKWVDSLGWNVIIRDSKKEAFAAVSAIRVSIYSVLSVMFLIALAAGFYFSRSLSLLFRQMSKNLLDNSTGVSQVAVELAEGSTKLSSSTNEQAAALQQTVASIDEVSAMVAKNADNAKRSQEVSAESAASAQKGKSAVTDVIRSMDEISDSNNQIISQIEEGNKQISEIVKVISEIGNKTKVINDIVFQTKLLSFNASVEAARAGEHGKGFAVVAEEVGNLAQMSGNAAKEISQMLENSIARVEQIVRDTQGRVERLMTLSKDKVSLGTTTAKRCGEALEEIVKYVSEVNAMVSEIAVASKEQAQGVAEINKAMNQLDQVTQANATSSQEGANNAEKLRVQSTQMMDTIRAFNQAVEGGSGDFAASVETVKEAEMDPAPVPTNLVTFKPKMIVSSEKPKAESVKKVVGSDITPSRNDSRFEEV